MREQEWLIAVPLSHRERGQGVRAARERRYSLTRRTRAISPTITEGARAAIEAPEAITARSRILRSS
ncbi:MAG: hypothetical protein CVU47_10585 [Chloroflexi bacterium HGW-Chloroflexi-9]|nr:MAG: hypothetical protein CVU47_10585 [Chloroflexi bacterium HGW-Chloroflexi-9]